MPSALHHIPEPGCCPSAPRLHPAGPQTHGNGFEKPRGSLLDELRELRQQHVAEGEVPSRTEDVALFGRLNSCKNPAATSGASPASTKTAGLRAMK